MYYILYISEATFAGLHGTVCAVDSINLYSETSVCEFYWCCVYVLQWRNVLCLL